MRHAVTAACGRPSRQAGARLGLHATREPRYTPRLVFRRRSSVVERILGKAEVGGSIPLGGTTFLGLCDTDPRRTVDVTAPAEPSPGE